MLYQEVLVLETVSGIRVDLCRGISAGASQILCFGCGSTVGKASCSALRFVSCGRQVVGMFFGSMLRSWGYLPILGWGGPSCIFPVCWLFLRTNRRQAPKVPKF